MFTGHETYSPREVTHVEWRRHDGVVLQRAIYTPASGTPSLLLTEMSAAYDVHIRPESAEEWAKIAHFDPEARTAERFDFTNREGEIRVTALWMV